MSPSPTGRTKHHCPGRDGWVGDISPGNCIQSCGKYHFASPEACRKCIGKMRADERRERVERQKAKEEKEEKDKNKEDDFLNLRDPDPDDDPKDDMA
ncbi:hypothetical protein COCSADRAFT_358815 [Bipolaris sorokiniana ND90Pr]|uniref:Uncharacterized protein n=1 Tax=Cochliobolus sativus (strain ND90Pr / ATCC 201652) TaxID=665912 RepID=M2T0R3_COCSN|nr:uncharacterized protein COCSADRAFT_358815 [Bipolaris sorokiniana ND90Pr]EMD62806.1 hypothetical protein COCSADRAFT_358815 [Bipolaris sorokiniana ND90Pr]